MLSTVAPFLIMVSAVGTSDATIEITTKTERKRETKNVFVNKHIHF